MSEAALFWTLSGAVIINAIIVIFDRHQPSAE